MSFLFSLERKAAKTLAMHAASSAHTEKSARGRAGGAGRQRGSQGGSQGERRASWEARPSSPTTVSANGPREGASHAAA